MAKEFLDHVGRKVVLESYPPQRIISLCPSQTETLFSLGLQAQVVGRTRFCVHPEPEINAVPRVGGTKEVKMERVKHLKPDLVVGEKEENTQAMVAELEQVTPVYVTEIQTIAAALKMVQDLGQLCGVPGKGERLAGQIEQGLASLQPFKKPVRCLYFIWRNPWMVVGKNTFIDAMLAKCGFENVAPQNKGRYPEVSPEFIAEAGVDCILLSSEPYPFQARHLAEIQAMVQVPVELVDGEMFSWYGSHLLEAVPYLQDKIKTWESVWAK